MVQHCNLKLLDRFFRHFKVVECIESVAYWLDLPSTILVHPVFHVSCLKKKLVCKNVLSPTLLPCDEDGVFKIKFEEIFEQCMSKKGSKAVIELPVKWKGLMLDETLQVEYGKLLNGFPNSRGKFFWWGKDCHVDLWALRLGFNY